MDIGVKTSVEFFYGLGALASVVDATESGQATARSLAPNAIISDNFDDILGDDQIQGIALATPAETHADLAIQAMQSGKDVFVEKPMALSISDAEAMQKVANETGAFSWWGIYWNTIQQFLSYGN